MNSPRYNDLRLCDFEWTRTALRKESFNRFFLILGAISFFSDGDELHISFFFGFYENFVMIVNFWMINILLPAFFNQTYHIFIGIRVRKSKLSPLLFLLKFIIET